MLIELIKMLKFCLNIDYLDEFNKKLDRESFVRKIVLLCIKKRVFIN